MNPAFSLAEGAPAIENEDLVYTLQDVADADIVTKGLRLVLAQAKRLPQGLRTVVEFPQPFMYNGSIQTWTFSTLCGALNDYSQVGVGFEAIVAFFDELVDSNPWPDGVTQIESDTLFEHDYWGQFFSVMLTELNLPAIAA